MIFGNAPLWSAFPKIKKSTNNLGLLYIDYYFRKVCIEEQTKINNYAISPEKFLKVRLRRAFKNFSGF